MPISCAHALRVGSLTTKDDLAASEVTIGGDDRLLELLWIKDKLPSKTMYVGAL